MKSTITTEKVSKTLFMLMAAVNETAILRKEVSRLRHHVSQLAKKLHRKEEELREERGKGRGVIIKVVERGEEKVEFRGGGEVARTLVEEEEVAVLRVRLPSVASSVVPSVADEVASEVAGENVVEEVEVVQLVESSVVARDGSAWVAMVVDEKEELLVRGCEGEDGRGGESGLVRTGWGGKEFIEGGIGHQCVGRGGREREIGGGCFEEGTSRALRKLGTGGAE